MKYIVVLITLLFPSILFSQNNYGPDVIPPSPEAASLGKYVDLQVSEYTGMVQQSVPIYTIKEGEMSLPISLEYQSGGFRIKESASWIGLGWSLNAGGVVTRASRGVPDDIGGGFLQTIESIDYEYLIAGPNENYRYEYLKQIANGCDDAEPDLFMFNFNGIQGKFNFNWEGDIVVNSNVKVEVEPIWAGSELGGFTITGPDGTIYTFSAVERTTVLSSGIVQCFISQIQHFNSSWFLTEIQSASGNRSVNLEYEDYLLKDYDIFHSYVRMHNTTGNSACPGTATGSDTWNTSNIKISGKRLARIYSSHSPVEIRFNTGDDRADLNGDHLYALGDISVFLDDSFTKKFDLNHDYSTGRLTLTSIQELSGDTYKNPYTFYYHTEDKLPGRSSNRWDAWGFLNKNRSSRVLPTYIINIFGTLLKFDGADRSPDFEGSRTGVLYKVEYPTKGFHEYEFELNSYSFINGGMLNENEIVTEPEYYELESFGTTDQCMGSGNLPADINEFTFTIDEHPYNPDPDYKTPVSVIGRADPHSEDYFGAGMAPKAELLDPEGTVLVSFSMANTGTEVIKQLPAGDYTMRTFAKFKCGPGAGTTYDHAIITVSFDQFTEERLLFKPTGGVRVKKIKRYDNNQDLLTSTSYEYTALEDIDGDTEVISSGFIYDEPRYQYGVTNYVPSGNFTEIECNSTVVLTKNRHLTEFTQGSHIGYKRVIAKQESGGNGFTELNFTTATDLIYQTIPFRPPTSGGYKTGLLKSKKLYDRNGTLVSEENSDHIFNQKSTRALKVHFRGANGPLASRHFDLGPYQLILGNSQAGEVEKTKHYYQSDERSSFKTIIDYDFDEGLHFLKEKLHKQYTGASTIDKVTKYFYPQDISSPSASISLLRSKHVLSQPVEVVELVEKNGESFVLNANHFAYSGVHLHSVNNLGVQEVIPEGDFNYSANNSGTMDERYTSTPEIELVYDPSNDLLTDKLQKGISTGYLWNNEGYLIAHASEANSNQIFHTSFEDSQGTSGNSKTGSKYMNSGTYNVRINGGFNAPSEVHLVMSYWYWQGGEWNYSGVVPYNESINAGSRLDEIRVYPEGAKMTTYTVNPVDGLTSVTDPNGITTYYNYDDVNRLIEQKDSDRNLKRYYKYHYVGQE